MSRVASLVVVIAMLSSGVAAAQPASPAPVAQKSVAPSVRLQIVLSRFNGDKRVASQPYALVTVANGMRKVLRTGAEVPVASTPAGAKESASGNSAYKSIGTNIRAEVTLQDDGRYLVNINVESSSPYADAQEKAGRPSFRNYSLDGMTYLRDGQTAEIAIATDTVTGEVIKMEVTVTAVK